MTSTLSLGSINSVAWLLEATLCQGNLDSKHNIWNIVSIEIYILYMLLHVYGKMNHLFCPKASFASGIHCQFLCVAQGKKQT
jgi:hypothetical protein